MDENYTINNDLRACGLPSNDEDDLAAGLDGVGSSVAPIIIDAADAGPGPGAAKSATATPSPTPGSTPSSTPSASTSTSSRARRRFAVWSNFEEVFEDLSNGKKIRVSAKCVHYCQVLTGRSSYGTGHLLQHQKVCLGKINHANLVHSRLTLNPDGSIHN
jgi:hypothetical protein